MNLKFSLVLCCALLSGAVAAKMHVAFKDVQALTPVEAEERIQYGSDPLQFGYFYRATQKDAPLVVMIHGGCWLSAFDVAHTRPMSHALKEAGYHVWTIEYRKLGDKGGKWPASLEDVNQALDYVKNTAQLNITPRKTLLLGHSAGGHLALLAGPKAPHVDHTLGLSAITNVTQYALGNNSCEKVTPKLLGNPRTQKARYQGATPDLNHADISLLHTQQDAIVNPSHAYQTQHNHVVLTPGGHFDWIHPDTQAFQRLLVQLEKVTKPL